MLKTKVWCNKSWNSCQVLNSATDPYMIRRIMSLWINESAALVFGSRMSRYGIPLLLFLIKISPWSMCQTNYPLWCLDVDEGPDLLKDLERYDRRNPSFIEPHLLDGPHVSSGVHPTQPRVAVSHKAMFLHFHIPQVFTVWDACVAGTRVNIQVVLQEDASHSFLFLLFILHDRVKVNISPT